MSDVSEHFCPFGQVFGVINTSMLSVNREGSRKTLTMSSVDRLYPDLRSRGMALKADVQTPYVTIFDNECLRDS